MYRNIAFFDYFEKVHNILSGEIFVFLKNVKKTHVIDLVPVFQESTQLMLSPVFLFKNDYFS